MTNIQNMSKFLTKQANMYKIVEITAKALLFSNANYRV